MSALRIGSLLLPGRVLLAPMAGISDAPFRELCHRFGAALCGAEMLTADQRLWGSFKSSRRMDQYGDGGIRAVQLAGSEPAQLAEAARVNAGRGAQLIDINMGCPAKKVCNRLCGSALLADEPLVGRILDAVVGAVDVPVTLKIRTGPDPTRRNAVAIAQRAEQCGIKAIAIHGRTRADRFAGCAEYDTIRAVKAAVRIPVIANGDILDGADARRVLDYTGADAVMLGRASQGAPWIFRAVNAFLSDENFSPPLLQSVRARIILQHLEALYTFYGEYSGLRVARKHLGWYCQRAGLPAGSRSELLAADSSVTQWQAAERIFDLAAEVGAAA
jgi:tRNA-dihydrouridine synthase B